MKNLLSPNFFPSNQLLSNLLIYVFSKCDVFTKFLPKNQFWQKFRESNGFTTEVDLIRRDFFSVRGDFSFFSIAK